MVLASLSIACSECLCYGLQSCLKTTDIQHESRRQRHSPGSRLCPGVSTTPTQTSTRSWLATVKRMRSLPRIYVCCATHLVGRNLIVVSPVYPSLTRQAVTIHHLQILFREAPYPTPIQIQLWAERLGVEKNDIEAWVQLEQDKLQQVLAHLPDSSTITKHYMLSDPESYGCRATTHTGKLLFSGTY